MKSDNEIIQLLESDPNEGMVQLMDQYLKLVHSIASGLKNPEDVKDCINDTFADFYRYRSSFDPNKGSLGNYLAAITRRNASDILAGNQKHTAEAYSNDIGFNPVNDWDAQIDMERAVLQLSSIDAELIRMKYYQGKSLQEIADSLDISYEATKKRHQRSLVALKKALITMLVLALLAAMAACAYVALRYFGIVPGYGLQTDPTEVHYVLSGGETVQSDHFRITVEDAWLHGSALDVRLRFEWSDQDTDICVLSREEYLKWYDAVRLGPEIGGKLTANVNISDWETGTFTTTYTLYDPQLTEDQEGMVCILLFDGAQIRFRVSETEPQTVEQAGCSVITENGGFYALPRMENGRLYVQIYPLDPEGYIINRNLSAHFFKHQFALSGDVTATAKDGTVLVGAINRNTDQVSDAFYDWDFGEAEPGEYQLHIPFVFLSKSYTSEDYDYCQSVVSFPNKEPVTILLPEGTVTVGCAESLEAAQDGSLRWWLPVEAQIDSPYRLLMSQLQLQPLLPEGYGETVGFHFSPVVEDGRLSGYHCQSPEPVDSVILRVKSLDYLWECDITIPIRVDG